MYLTSGVDYYVVVLEEIDIVCKSGLIIRSPNIQFRLLSYPDINKVMLMEQSGLPSNKINEEVFNKCIIGIIGFNDEQIDFEESPAGIIDHLSHKILTNSKKLIENIEESFAALSESASLYERLALVVSHYTNNSYEFTQQLPIDELIKRYALCAQAFPQTVPPLVFEKEEESRVGS
jgi:hypothetical protein